ncbi:DUF2487 family protein [Ornithinibacillus halotolerans]|uniref:DUF2487 family protein n=1 Tax=Ornithinibacillus halotolerans TaxID=1274357 RepID=A0A916RLV5_9BACI|nr:DUF2487 family protein [Ornithinibacillus halotolerans]GGA61376.1 hypothetical protein GCM10008025_01690 [Ornithinibacillus halotolerans]
MQWTSMDMEKYLSAKEYIDTAIIPIIPFQLSHETTIGKSTSKRELVSIFATEIESELSGRTLLVPNYYYLEFGDKEEEVKRLNAWTKEIQSQPFKHVFVLTFDSIWKRYEKDLDANLLWLPGFQTEGVNPQEMMNIIRGQVSDVVELMRSYW